MRVIPEKDERVRGTYGLTIANDDDDETSAADEAVLSCVGVVPSDIEDFEDDGEVNRRSCSGCDASGVDGLDIEGLDDKDEVECKLAEEWGGESGVDNAEPPAEGEEGVKADP